ncbi:MAG: HD domain-containing protein [Clostridia bacterium]|nr:HD domain-containing protein [Clostridia bacterium]
MNWKLPQDVLYIINTLNQKGYKAYAVGGCVRDMFLKKTPQDWDITTSAPPEAIIDSFPKTIPTGIKHGTVTVLCGKTPYEVTTFRVDGAYEDHRKPETVTFTEDIREDLSRRDFTMNAMAYHPETGLRDPFGGREDIERKLIRCVGDPLVRFDEDALRMLRAVRFSAQTGFSIDEDILAAMKTLAPLLSAISGERVRDELVKTLLSDRPAKVRVLHETGLLAVILPELDRCFYTHQNHPYHILNVGDHSLRVLENTPKSLSLRLAALLHDIGKPDMKTTDEAGIDHFKGHGSVSTKLAEEIIARLRLDNKTKDAVLLLVREHDRQFAVTKKSIRRAASIVGKDMFFDLLSLQVADALGQNPTMVTERLARLEAAKALYNEILADEDALSVSDLAIGGRDLLELGYCGKEIGAALSKALELVLDDPSANQKEILLKKIQNTD